MDTTTSINAIRRSSGHRPGRAAAVAVMALGLPLGLGLGLGLSGCTSMTGPAAPATATTQPITTTPGVATTTTLEPERDVTVAGRHFKAQCAGSGPSVIMVADYGPADGRRMGHHPANPRDEQPDLRL